MHGMDENIRKYINSCCVNLLLKNILTSCICGRAGGILSCGMSMQGVKILFSNWFRQQQLMYFLMVDQ
jgi:hypothetical protein